MNKLKSLGSFCQDFNALNDLTTIRKDMRELFFAAVSSDNFAQLISLERQSMVDSYRQVQALLKSIKRHF